MGLRDDYLDEDRAGERGQAALAISTSGLDELSADAIDKAAVRFQRREDERERAYWAANDSRIGGS